MSLRPDPMRLTELRSQVEEQSEELAMLQSGVRQLRKQNGTAAQTDALAARLGPELATHVVAGTALISSALLRFVFVGAGLVGLGMGAYWLAGQDAPQLAHKPAPIAAHHEERPLAPPVVEAALTVPAVPTARGPQAAPLEAPVAKARPIAPRPRADKPKEQSADPEAELALLGRAQALLDRDPDGALDVLGEHARVYERGLFIEEREVLSLEAESKLGHKALARARAERFMAKFPRSAHARRVRTLLEPHP